MPINTVSATGRLTNDAALRKSQKGTSVVSFRLAIPGRFKDDKASFVSCVMFGNYADAMQPHLLKGRKIGVQGRLQTSEWDKDGQHYERVEIVVDTMELFDGGKQEKQEVKVDDVYDMDIPF